MKNHALVPSVGVVDREAHLPGTRARVRRGSIAPGKYEAMVKLSLAETLALIAAGIAAIAAPVVIGAWNAPLVLAQALPIPPDSAPL